MKRRTRERRCESLEPRALLSATVGDATAAYAADVGAAGDDEPIAVPQASIAYPGGVTVTETSIITPADVIPRFVAEPTISAVRTGAWIDPGTWSLGRLPTDGDRVLIPEGMTVSYLGQHDAPIDAIEVWGTLAFTPTSGTRLIVGTLTVMPTGTLQIGTVGLPVRSYATAEIVIADQPLDLVNDPSQYGNGLLSFGKVSIHGSIIGQTWTRLAVEPLAGDTYLVVPNVDAAWRAGDTLVLPDTRQVPTSKKDSFVDGLLEGQWEEVTIDHVAGSRIYLTEPLAYDHRGARDTNGVLQLLPHVALLNRNVIVRSENPEGTRGHVLLAARSDVDIRYARFSDLGRTDAFRDLDNTTYDEQGNVTHIGTNQIARYAMHFHHMIGPENPTNTGYQYQFVGNTVDRALKWGVAVHGTSYGRLADNVVYDAQGAGMVTEDGSEIENVFRDNITVRIIGTHVDGKSGTQEGDYARGGSGFWFRRGGNTIIGNVAADSTYAGFVFDGYYNTDTVRLPLFRGAMKLMIGQGITVELSPQTTFLDNEAYGLSTYGLWAAYISGHNLTAGQPQTTFVDLRVWHVLNAGLRMYHTSNVTILNSTFYGDWAAQDRNDTGTFGMYLVTYENRDLVIRGTRIEGMRYGIIAPRSDSSEPGRDQPTRIENSWLKNYINILVAPAWDYGPGDEIAIDVRNVKFDLFTTLPPGPDDPGTIDSPANIRMQYDSQDADLTKRVAVKVYDYNQVPGDDFQVYFHEQLPNQIVPQTDPELLDGSGRGTIGAPAAGLTNAQAWDAYGISIGGKPIFNPRVRWGISGLVGPLVDASEGPLRVVLVTPWDQAQIGTELPIRVRYNVNGQLPDNGYVFFSLDGGPSFNTFKNGGLYGLEPGWHTLRAFIGNLLRMQIPGTIDSLVSFHVPDIPAGSSDAAADPAFGAISAGLAAPLEESLAAIPTNAAGAFAAAPGTTFPLEASIETHAKAAQTVRPTATDAGFADEADADDSIADELLSDLAVDVLAADSRSASVLR